MLGEKRGKEADERLKPGGYIKEWLESAAYAAIVLIVLYFLCWPFKVSGESMEDTLHPGDRIVVSRVLSYAGSYGYGDLVVCTVAYGDAREVIVKRIVGLPGDRIQIIGGCVYLNESVLSEPYLGNTTTPGNLDIELGDSEYFVMGDNRAISFDSRSAGPIASKDMVGKVVARWFPFLAFEVY